ncbi:MAG: tetratricopeptide repeat protein [Alphaproteobacteria bacterium]|nr:tetratricopeptide repeat protein [Alphaproteobacteria bacterium]
MSDIFREVDEEIRQEQIINFLKTYGKYIAGGIVLLIIIYGGYRYFDAQQTAEREAAGEQFSAALENVAEDDLAQAVADFAAIAGENSDSGYGLLARFRQADALVAAREIQGGVAVYDGIADDSSVPEALRQLAGLFAVMAVIDSAPRDEIDRRVEPLIEPGAAWRQSALELKGLAAYEAGDLEAALSIFKTIEEEAAQGSGLRARATQMIAITERRLEGRAPEQAAASATSEQD